jgi:hypothetical protein
VAARDGGGVSPTRKLPDQLRAIEEVKDRHGIGRGRWTA